jgi:hypothetical protein
LWRQGGDPVADCRQRHRTDTESPEEMNVQLSNVFSDLSGVSGINIVGAILEGERDPRELGALIASG